LGDLQDLGITPDRVEMIGHVSPEEYFQNYHRIDIALDPFPYPGGTTTCDALWMGVPVITLAGRSPVQREGVSILSNAGLGEMIAPTRADYIRLAIDLASDPIRLTGLRSTLRERLLNSPLMDAASYARSIEEAFRAMWRSWCNSFVQKV
jgi:predicted O-linked N-acetylglucosamine transferase (SPINDLY family)